VHSHHKGTFVVSASLYLQEQLHLPHGDTSSLLETFCRNIAFLTRLHRLVIEKSKVITYSISSSS